MNKEIEIPEGYEARIEGNKIILELKESEDERIRKNIICWLKNIEGQTIPINEYNSALAWLERQKEQKSAEWSEEDEAAYGDLIWCIEQARKSAKDENDLGNIWFTENWVKNRLKFLRPQPHWKPSEELIYSLGTVVKGYDNCTVGSVAYNLKELYEQLRKLL